MVKLLHWPELDDVPDEHIGTVARLCALLWVKPTAGHLIAPTLGEDRAHTNVVLHTLYAMGYVDLSSGMILGIKTVDSHPVEVIELLAAATTDLFQGLNVVVIEKLFRKARGVAEDGAHYFQEMIVLSDNLIHVFLRAREQTQVACFCCRKGANVGMVLTKTRMVIPELEKSLTA